MKPCAHCGEPIVGRRAIALYCSLDCRRARADALDRARKQAIYAALRRKRPRCLICDNPLPYGTRGFRHGATTCSRRCAVTKWNWYFHRRSIDADRRALAES